MKSELRIKQELFMESLGRMLAYARELGIGVTLGDGHRDARLHGEFGTKMGYGSANSLHKLRLAVDLNAINPADHSRLHDYWDTVGGSARIAGDMNHYSFEWKGFR